MLRKLMQGAAFITALFLLGSCGAGRNAHLQRLMLQGIDTAKSIEVNAPEPTIKKGDLLTIMIYSDNIEATEIYNQPQTGGTSGGGNVGNPAAMGRGYQVDANGQVYVHSIGQMKVIGLTKSQLSNIIKDSLSQFLLNPYVTVRYSNTRINVLGEVAKPGVIEITDNKVSVLDAIGLAGDFTSFSKRNNVLVVREQEGKRITGRLDFTKADLYESPFFYLQQNDLVYVEPNRKKPTGGEEVLARNIGIVSGILSVVVLLITLVSR